MRSNNRLKSFLKRMRPGALYLVLIICLVMLIPPARNLILKPVWPRSWVPLSTYQVLKIFFVSNIPANVVNIVCSQKKLFSKDFTAEVYNIKKCESHQREKFRKISQLSWDNLFQPIINDSERCDLLSLYAEMSAILSRASLSHFLISGSLLGVYRHHGLIPWDDDIDVAANGSEWEKFRSTLSCAEGYRLAVNPNMHWKFMREDSYYPFIDIFFYTEDDRYLWGMTNYANKELAHEKTDIFPLGITDFEGILAPIPRNLKTVTLAQHNPNYCQSPSLLHKNNTSTKGVIRVLCSTLSDVYTMHNLRVV